MCEIIGLEYTCKQSHTYNRTFVEAERLKKIDWMAQNGWKI